MALTNQERQMIKEQLIKEVNGDPDFVVDQLLTDLPPAAQVRWFDWLKEKHNAECVADSDAHLARIIP